MKRDLGVAMYSSVTGNLTGKELFKAGENSKSLAVVSQFPVKFTPLAFYIAMFI